MHEKSKFSVKYGRKLHKITRKPALIKPNTRKVRYINRVPTPRPP